MFAQASFQERKLKIRTFVVSLDNLYQQSGINRINQFSFVPKILLFAQRRNRINNHIASFAECYDESVSGLQKINILRITKIARIYLRKEVVVDARCSVACETNVGSVLF